jgi:hypothetical protein
MSWSQTYPVEISEKKDNIKLPKRLNSEDYVDGKPLENDPGDVTVADDDNNRPNHSTRTVINYGEYVPDDQTVFIEIVKDLTGRLNQQMDTLQEAKRVSSGDIAEVRRLLTTYVVESTTQMSGRVLELVRQVSELTEQNAQLKTKNDQLTRFCQNLSQENGRIRQELAQRVSYSPSSSSSSAVARPTNTDAASDSFDFDLNGDNDSIPPAPLPSSSRPAVAPSALAPPPAPAPAAGMPLVPSLVPQNVGAPMLIQLADGTVLQAVPVSADLAQLQQPAFAVANSSTKKHNKKRKRRSSSSADSDSESSSSDDNDDDDDGDAKRVRRKKKRSKIEDLSTSESEVKPGFTVEVPAPPSFAPRNRPPNQHLVDLKIVVPVQKRSIHDRISSSKK